MSNDQANIDYQAIIEGLGQGILLFNSEDRLVLDNQPARNILGANLPLIRSEGWSALAMLLDARRTDSMSATELRTKALNQTEPLRFHALLSGAYTPCWVSKIDGADGGVYTMIMLETPDWTALNELMTTFREEAHQAITSTGGHADLILQVLKKRTSTMSADKLAERIQGFAEIMSKNMYNLQLLVDLLQRLEMIRTGQLIERVRQSKRRIALLDFFEDFLEELSKTAIIDPARNEDIRQRVTLQIPSKTEVSAASEYLKNVIRDVLRNALMYSVSGTPVTVKATKTQQGSAVQIDITDQGIGIRAKEAERVFAPFQRARQPQVIAEFGYGLSLHLAKAELEAMGGRIWYESEEGVGTTFSIKLPAWQEK